MKRIVLDIGHGSNTFPPSKGVYLTDTGLTGSPTGKWFEEHDFNSKVAVLAREKLKAYDVEVLFTQEPNADDVPLRDRVSLVRKWHKEYPIDLLISIHANAHYPNSPASGFESYHWQGDVEGGRFCRIWNSKMYWTTGMINRGVKVSSQYKNSWYIVKNSPCTAVLLEHFFYTNYEELKKWGNDEGVKELADILFRAVVSYFNLEKKKKTLTVNINGTDKEMDFLVKDNRNFVSIREVAEALGATVEWDSVNKKVLIMKGE